MSHTPDIVHELVPGGRSAPTAVLCPFAGGSAYSMREWAATLPGYRLLALQYPGRGTRLREPFARSIDDLVDQLLHDLVAGLQGAQPVLVGHSMGTCVAVEIARRLRSRGTQPLALIASAAGPPGPPADDEMSPHLTDDETLGRALGDWGGLPREVLDEPELLALTLPAVRSDFAIAAEYAAAYQTEDLGLPIIAVGGDRDPVVPYEQLAAWREHTTSATTVRVLPGDHFYYRDSAADLAGIFGAHLDAPLSTDVAGAGAGAGASAVDRGPAGEARTSVRSHVRDAWKGALPEGPLLPTTRFFAAGGSSLGAMRVCARLSADLSVRVPVRLLLEHDSLAEFGEQVELLVGSST